MGSEHKRFPASLKRSASVRPVGLKVWSGSPPKVDRVSLQPFAWPRVLISNKQSLGAPKRVARDNQERNLWRGVFQPML